MGLFSSLPGAPDRAQIAMVRTRRSSQAAPLRVAFLHPDLGLGGECSALPLLQMVLSDVRSAATDPHRCAGCLQGRSASSSTRRWSSRATATRCVLVELLLILHVAMCVC